MTPADEARRDVTAFLKTEYGGWGIDSVMAEKLITYLTPVYERAHEYVHLHTLLVSEERRNDTLQAQLTELRSLLDAGMGQEWVDEALERIRRSRR